MKATLLSITAIWMAADGVCQASLLSDIKGSWSMEAYQAFKKLPPDRQKKEKAAVIAELKSITLKTGNADELPASEMDARYFVAAAATLLREEGSDQEILEVFSDSQQFGPLEGEALNTLGNCSGPEGIKIIESRLTDIVPLAFEIVDDLDPEQAESIEHPPETRHLLGLFEVGFGALERAKNSEARNAERRMRDLVAKHATSPNGKQVLASLDEQLAKEEKKRASKNRKASEAAETSKTLPARSTSQPATEIVAGGRKWKPEFADKNLGEATRQRIIQDLNLVFGHLTECKIDVMPAVIEVEGRQLDRRVTFTGGSRMWNKAFQSDSFACLFKDAGEDGLYIPDSIIRKYTGAIELEKQHHQAIEQLNQFLDRANRLADRPVENVADLLVIHDEIKITEADRAEMTPEAISKAWGGVYYREPSILDITETAGTPHEKYGPLVATTYIKHAETLKYTSPLIYHKGAWRFFVLPIP